MNSGPPLLPDGTSVGGWRIIRRLGEGGMAEVYLADHPRLPRQDVIKVMRPWLAQDPGFNRKFRAEADRMSALSGHAHIVTIFDQLEEEGLLCLVLQYAPGGDLRSVLRKAGRLPTGQVLALGRQIASALDAGHALGIIHRDVKPENVLLKGPSLTEPVLLADFGISLLAEGSEQSTLTQSLMTPTYAAPEQFDLQPIDGRADQYSLACMLYELLSGRTPFIAPTAASLMKAHIFDPMPRIAGELGLPPAVDAVLARALAKRAQDRFASCSAFVEGLRQAASQFPDFGEPRRDRTSSAATSVNAYAWPPRGNPGPFGTPPRRGAGDSGAWGVYGAPALEASPPPVASRPAPSVQRVAAQIAFFALPVVTFGMAAWVPAAWAWAVHRTRLELLALLGLLTLSLTGVVLAALGDSNTTNGDSALNSAGGGLLICAILLGEVVALLFRRRTFAPRATDALSSDPAVAAAVAGRQRRLELRALAARDPALARQLRVGRPDLIRQVDDAGLVDLNAVGAPDLARALGITPEAAHSIVGARDRIGRISSIDEAIYYGDLAPEAVERLREYGLIAGTGAGQ